MIKEELRSSKAYSWSTDRVYQNFCEINHIFLLDFFSPYIFDGITVELHMSKNIWWNNVKLRVRGDFGLPVYPSNDKRKT